METRWRLEESERTSELMLMRVKEDTNEEMLRAHEWELELWDYLIQLLKRRWDVYSSS